MKRSVVHVAHRPDAACEHEKRSKTPDIWAEILHLIASKLRLPHLGHCLWTVLRLSLHTSIIGSHFCVCNGCAPFYQLLDLLDFLDMRHSVKYVFGWLKLLLIILHKRECWVIVSECFGLQQCGPVYRLCWIHSRRFSTASSTEALDCATSGSCYATPIATVIMITCSPGLLRVVRRHLQEWMQTNRHHCCPRSTNHCVCHDRTSGFLHRSATWMPGETE